MLGALRGSRIEAGGPPPGSVRAALRLRALQHGGLLGHALQITCTGPAVPSCAAASALMILGWVQDL